MQGFHNSQKITQSYLGFLRVFGCHAVMLALISLAEGWGTGCRREAGQASAAMQWAEPSRDRARTLPGHLPRCRTRF